MYIKRNASLDAHNKGAYIVPIPAMGGTGDNDGRRTSSVVNAFVYESGFNDFMSVELRAYTVPDSQRCVGRNKI